MEVGAISLILELPSDMLEVEGAYLNDDPGITVLHNVIGNELRLSWYSLTPLELNDGDAMITLQLKTTADYDQSEIAITLAWDPHSELADGEYNVIEDALITTAIINGEPVSIDEVEIAGKGDLDFANHPNPFRQSTNFTYTLPHDGEVSIEVLDITGSRVKVILDGKLQQAGKHVATMDAVSLQPGVYFATITCKGKDAAIKRSTIRIVIY